MVIQSQQEGTRTPPRSRRNWELHEHSKHGSVWLSLDARLLSTNLAQSCPAAGQCVSGQLFGARVCAAGLILSLTITGMLCMELVLSDAWAC
jgi:hypothetical protein